MKRQTERQSSSRKSDAELCCLIVTPACRPVTARIHPAYLDADVNGVWAEHSIGYLENARISKVQYL